MKGGGSQRAGSLRTRRRADPAPPFHLFRTPRTRRSAASPEGCGRVTDEKLVPDNGGRGSDGWRRVDLPQVSDAPQQPDEATVLRQRVAELEAQVEAMNRLATLGTLAATLAHEVNNLATPALNYARLGEKALADNDSAMAGKALTRCGTAADRSARLCRSILSFAKPSGPLAQPCRAELAAAVGEAIEAMVRPPQQDGVELDVSIPAGLAAAVEPTQLEHVLLNLLLNARRALLTVPMSRRRLSIVAADEGAAGRVRLSVSDTGGGIDPSVLPRLFQPFGSGPGGGSGLGLSLCRRIAERHGGHIEADSRLGDGASFTLTLPRAA